MEEFIMHLDYAKKLGALSVGVILITIITYFIFKKNRFIKYLPGLILFIIGLYNLLFLGKGSNSANELNRISLAIMAMVTSFVGLATGLIIGVWGKGETLN